MSLLPEARVQTLVRPHTAQQAWPLRGEAPDGQQSQDLAPEQVWESQPGYR